MKKLLILCFIIFTACTSNDKRVEQSPKSVQTYKNKKLEAYSIYEYGKDNQLLKRTKYDKNGKVKNEEHFDYEGKEVLELSKIELSLKEEKKSIYADNYDKVEFKIKAFNKYGEEISNKGIKIYKGEKKLKKKNFSTKKVGEFVFKAKLGKIESNSIKIRTKKHSNPVSNEYLQFFSHKKLHNIEIKLSKKTWEELKENLKRNPKSSEYVKADMFYKSDLGAVKMKDVAFRVRGNASRRNPEGKTGYQKAPFKIKFDETFDMKKTDKFYNKTKRRRLFSMSNLNLKWNRTYDNTQIREMFNYELMEKVGLVVPKTASVLLKINIEGEIHNYGLYTLVESIDEEFVKKRYGMENSRGNLYKCLYPATLSLDSIKNRHSIGIKNMKKGYRPIYDLKTNKDKKNHKRLKEFIEALDYYRGGALVTYLEKNFEVDKFIKYMALNTLIGMTDDYRDNSNNYYLYFANNGKMDFIPYDYDSGIGGGWPGWRFNKIANLDIYRKSDKSILASKILKERHYRKRYEDYIKEFIDFKKGVFRYENFEKKYYEMYKVYNGKIENEMGEGDKMFLDEIVKKYFDAKIDSIIDQLGIMPELKRDPRKPDLTISDINDFLSRLNALEVDKRDKFMYDNFRRISSKTKFPIVKGENVTFVYNSGNKKLKSLELRGEMNGWGFGENRKSKKGIEFTNIEGTNLFIYKMKIKKGAYEYKLTENNAREWVIDKLNPLEKMSGFGPNSYLIVE